MDIIYISFYIKYIFLRIRNQIVSWLFIKINALKLKIVKNLHLQALVMASKYVLYIIYCIIPLY